MSDHRKSSAPKLGPGASDHAATVLRMGVGAIPVLGPALNELITEVIPGVRMERIEVFLRYLDSRLSELEQDRLIETASEATAIELIEEGAAQAVRALNDVRHQRLAELVATGVSGDEQRRLETKRLLHLMREIDDDQIIILASKTRQFARDDAFWNAHEDILTGPRAHLGSDRATVEASTVYRLTRERLVALGLLAHKYKKPGKSELPEFDHKTGRMKSTGLDVTPLGRLLLERIGMIQSAP